LDDIFEVQDSVAQAIVDALQLNITPEEKRRVSERPIDNVLAYQSYLKARQEIYSYRPDDLDDACKDIQEALKALMNAGSEALAWIQQIGAIEGAVMSMGFVNGAGGATKAPFDYLADTLRGSRGIMIDMYRQTDMLLKAMERIIPKDSQTVKGHGLRPDELNPDLAHDKNLKEFMAHSGELAVTNNEFHAFYGIFEGLKKAGFDTTVLVNTFDGYQRLTPDLDGGSRRDILQLLAQPKLLVPGVGSFNPQEQEDKKGILTRIKEKLTGNKQPAQR
jgi:hypothetical protein